MLWVRLYALMRCDPCMMHAPEVLFLVSWHPAQLESLNALTHFGASCQTNLQTNRGLPKRYLTTRFRATQSPFLGDDILLEHSLLANKMSGRSRAR